MSKSPKALTLIALLAIPLGARADDDVYRGPLGALVNPYSAFSSCIIIDPCSAYGFPTYAPGFLGGTAAPPLATSAPIREPARGYAKPMAAPPSAVSPSVPTQTPPPPKLPAPASPRPPAVSEERSYYDTYPVAPDRSSRPLGERCSIEFWNLSSRELTLKVDGSPRLLKPGQNLVLELARHFVWQVEGRAPQHENIPLGESALEIVIRR